jgi:hypothetical protein
MSLTTEGLDSTSLPSTHEKARKSHQTLLGLMVRIATDDPDITADDMVTAVIDEGTKLVMQEGFAMVYEGWDFFVRLHHSKVCPKSPKPDLTPEEKAAAKKAAKTKRKIAEAIIDTRIDIGMAKLVWTNVIMPNGKPVLECTGAEIREFEKAYPKLFAFIAKFNIADDELVGDKVTAEQLNDLKE